MKKIKIMSLLFSVLSVVVLLIPPLSALAAGSIPIDDYWPLREGNLWVYDDGELEALWHKNRLSLVEDTEQGCTSETNFVIWSINGRGLFLAGVFDEEGGGILKPPVQLTKKFPDVGDSIGNITFFEEKFVSVTSWVVGYEDVTVPAGTFDNCLKISVDITVIAPAGEYDYHKTYFWFAEGVGIVKMQQYETRPGSDGCFVTDDERNLIHMGQ